MLERLRDRIGGFLAAHQVGVLGATGPEGARAAVVRYRHQNLEVECLVPRWCDVAYALQRDPRVSFVVQDSAASGTRWLHCLGLARVVEQPNWTVWQPLPVPPAHAAHLYLVVHVTPCRIDLLDERLGWGGRETWEV